MGGVRKIAVIAVVHRRSYSKKGGVAEQGKQAVYDRTQTDQNDEELEKLCEPRVGTESVDGPEQYCPEYDCNEDSNYERNHDGLAILSRQSHKIRARAIVDTVGI
jgi:hypothetical protein